MVAAIGVSGPIERLRAPTLKALTLEVAAAAKAIGDALAGPARIGDVQRADRPIDVRCRPG